VTNGANERCFKLFIRVIRPIRAIRDKNLISNKFGKYYPWYADSSISPVILCKRLMRLFIIDNIK
jgi:hypothetical protein